jgi:peptide/nickel transport system permease protein
MARIVLNGLLHAAVVVAGVCVAVFFLVRLGGDPTGLFLPPDASAADMALFRHQMGFDQPLAVQFGQYVWRALHGDFGRSLRYGQPALALVLERLPATIELSAVSLAISVAVSVPIAVISAQNHGSAIDQAGLLASLVGQSFPAFWLAIMLILVFSEWLGVLPPSGRDGWRSLVMPAASLAAYSTAIITRLLRSNIIDVLQADHVRTAHSKGLRNAPILFRHVLRNAAIPTVAVVGMQVGSLLGGAVITEQIFAWPGMGQLAVQAIANRDFAVVQAFVVVMAVLIVAVNLLVDMSFTLLDPRLREA